MKEVSLHILKSLRTFIGYAVCIVICTLYTLYVDGSSGVLLLSFMILIPIISIVFMMVASKSINVKLKVSNDTVKKNSNVDVTIEFNKRNVIPIPFINLTLGYSPHINALNFERYSPNDFPNLRFSMAFEKVATHKYGFSTKVSGKGSIYVKEMYIYDYLGFFRIKLKGIHSTVDVYITPEVRDVKSSQELFNSICNDVLTNDEEETSNSDNVTSMSSTLGYLHRDYVVGDSPRRINWKLSCKKSKLMVRLDEPSTQTRPCFLIDMSVNRDNPNRLESLLNFESLIESSLSLMNMCLKYGIECECILFNCENPVRRIVTSIDDIYSFAVLMSYGGEDGNHTLPKEVSNLESTNESMYILFTDVYDTLKVEINDLRRKKVNLNVVLSPQYYGSFSSPNVWIVNKDLSINPSSY